MSSHLVISVVIPHLNQPAHLARCLESLQAGRRLPDEIIVVDNGSVEMPRDICARHGVTLLVEPEPGPGPARNHGIAAAKGDVLAFIDADCLADPGWLEAAERALSNPRAEILGGDVRIALKDPARPTALEAYESEYAYRMDRYIAREGFTGTGNLVVRRAVLEAVGPFAGLAIAEDRDWGQRATRTGHTIAYVPEMRVYHPARESLDELYAKWDRQLAHDFARAQTRRNGRLQWAIKTIAMAPSSLGELPRLAVSRRIPGGSMMRVRALCTLTRLRGYRAWRMAQLLAGGDADTLSRRWNRK